MFDFDDKNIRKFERLLKDISSVAVPFAVRSTLNSLAFDSRAESQKNISGNMILRNQFTKRSLQVMQAKALKISSMEAVMGTIASYLEVQEFGGTKSRGGKKGIPIATSASSGEGNNTKPRRRLPKPSNRMMAIRLRKRRRRGATAAQSRFIAVKEAASSNRKYIYMDLGRRQGIFKVMGGKKNPRVKMMHDLSSVTVRVPKNPWMKPSVDTSVQKTERFYKKALIFQLRRQGFNV